MAILLNLVKNNLLFRIFLPLSLISICAFQCSGDHRFLLPVNTVSPVHWNAALLYTICMYHVVYHFVSHFIALHFICLYVLYM